MSKQQQYETAKQRLRSKNLSPAEYERQIQQLLNKKGRGISTST
jgi:hypothetical protein